MIHTWSAWLQSEVVVGWGGRRVFCLTSKTECTAPSYTNLHTIFFLFLCSFFLWVISLNLSLDIVF